MESVLLLEQSSALGSSYRPQECFCIRGKFSLSNIAPFYLFIFYHNINNVFGEFSLVLFYLNINNIQLEALIMSYILELSNKRAMPCPKR